MSTLASFSQHLASLIESVAHTEFPERLIATLKTLVPIDDATIMYYPQEGLPVIEHYEVPAESEDSSLLQFVQGAFLVDPFYLAAVKERRFGLFQLRELAPEGFRDSDYYKNYYRNCAYEDECGYLIRTGPASFVNISLGKNRPRARFGKREMEVLREVFPPLEVLCQQHWAPLEDKPEPNGTSLRQQMGQALEGFGTSLLTERETQVINLVLHGHSTKTVAEKLNISMETVKLHRKHAYAKLEVGSQAELFYLFLDSLMSAQDYVGGDTLVEYMRPPGEQRLS
ncbi:MAG: helix-turn-helix transcriptional regulator [Pseudomonadota bacterium]